MALCRESRGKLTPCLLVRLRQILERANKKLVNGDWRTHVLQSAICDLSGKAVRKRGGGVVGKGRDKACNCYVDRLPPRREDPQ